MAALGMALIAAAGIMIAARSQQQSAQDAVAHRLTPMAAAQRNIGFIAADLHLIAVLQERAIRAARITMVAFLPQWQIVRTSRISSAQASKAADPGNRLPLKSTRSP